MDSSFTSSSSTAIIGITQLEANVDSVKYDQAQHNIIETFSGTLRKPSAAAKTPATSSKTTATLRPIAHPNSRGKEESQEEQAPANHRKPQEVAQTMILNFPNLNQQNTPSCANPRNSSFAFGVPTKRGHFVKLFVPAKPDAEKTLENALYATLNTPNFTIKCVLFIANAKHDM